MLRARSIDKVLGNRRILHGVSLSIEAGKITALMGPSGSGKTTLLRALALVDPPDRGTIEIDTKVYQFPGSTDPETPWPNLTVVFQDIFLWPHLTNYQNIALPALEQRRASHAFLRELVRDLGLEDVLSRYPNQISRGQRQLVALARALALKPRILLLDEISASLDLHRIAVVSARILRLLDDGVGVLLITHQLAFVRRIATSVAYMSDGRILEQGPKEILDNPSSAELRAFVKLAAEAF